MKFKLSLNFSIAIEFIFMFCFNATVAYSFIGKAKSCIIFDLIYIVMWCILHFFYPYPNPKSIYKASIFL